MLPEQIAVTMLVVDVLEALGVVYAIGGSFAGALHGVMRATMDGDLGGRPLSRTQRAVPIVGPSGSTSGLGAASNL